MRTSVTLTGWVARTSSCTSPRARISESRWRTCSPTRNTRTFATSVDYQDVVRLNILEGESRQASGNRLLGELLLFDLRRAKRGGVKIDVSFEIDTDGMLNVTARDTSTNQVQRVKLSVAGSLNRDQAATLRAQDLPASAF